MDFNSEIIQIKEKDRAVEIKRKIAKTFTARVQTPHFGPPLGGGGGEAGQ